MRTLSIRQPWASLIALGEKTIECRTWATSYRGPLLIHASGPDIDCDGLIAPGGYAIATARLVDVRPLTAADLEATCLGEMPDAPMFAWVLANAREIEPFPLKGRLGLFDTDATPQCLESASEEWTHINAIMRLRAVA